MTDDHPTAPLERLTARELEVLRLIARGLDNREIADALVLSVATVKSHVNRVFLKLGARDRAQAVIAAYEAGVVRAGESTHGLRDGASPSPMEDESPHGLHDQRNE